MAKFKTAIEETKHDLSQVKVHVYHVGNYQDTFPDDSVYTRSDYHTCTKYYNVVFKSWIFELVGQRYAPIRRKNKSENFLPGARFLANFEYEEHLEAKNYLCQTPYITLDHLYEIQSAIAEESPDEML